MNIRNKHIKTPRCKSFVDKSLSAALSAIEIYNNPNIKYREETFTTLILNSWELLLKAKIILENRYPESIYVLVNKISNKGHQLKLLTPKINRSNNPVTIDLERCLDICEQQLMCLDKVCKGNIILLMEIRDTVIIHFHNRDLYCKKIYEIGTASLKNYLILIKEWFDYDLSEYNFYLKPPLHHEFKATKGFSFRSEKEQIKNLLQYISRQESENPPDETRLFNISLPLETKCVKPYSTDSLSVSCSDDLTALPVAIQEEDPLKGYPIDYKALTHKLRERYINFKANPKYYKLIKVISKNKNFCRVRLLYPENPHSSKKHFFSSEIFKELDKHYTKK